jgi:oligoribonuclease NrnB/cAMP/cGMP phosphodiesterase (DHH superfamily)
MIGIYHSADLDGICSGALMKIKYPDIKLFGYDYGKPFDINIEGENIIMSDISLPIQYMYEVSKKAKSFVWIDHHISKINDYYDFIKKYNNNQDFLIPVLDTNYAACEGTWKYLYSKDNYSTIPSFVKLLGEYDTWKNSDLEHWNNKILPFQYGMKLLYNKVECFLDNGICENEILNIIEKGKITLQYQKQLDEKNANATAFEAEFEGYKAICMNVYGANSSMFDSVYIEGKHDIMIPFCYTGKFWKVSIYTKSDVIDCSLICSRHLGGGHRQAAGFSVNDIKTIFPFM